MNCIISDAISWDWTGDEILPTPSALYPPSLLRCVICEWPIFFIVHWPWPWACEIALWSNGDGWSDVNFSLNRWTTAVWTARPGTCQAFPKLTPTSFPQKQPEVWNDFLLTYEQIRIIRTDDGISRNKGGWLERICYLGGKQTSFLPLPTPKSVTHSNVCPNSPATLFPVM